MHQGRGLERLPGLLLGRPLGDSLLECVIDQESELLGRRGVAVLDSGKDRVTSFIDTAPHGRSGGVPTGTRRRCRCSEAFRPDRHASSDGSIPA